MSHFPTCVMHRILVIRTIQGDQNVRRLHRDADLKMAGERKKKQFHGTGSSMYEWCPPTPDLTNVLYSIHAPNNQTNFSLSSTPPRSNQRKSDQKQKSWSGARRALRSAPSTPPPRRSKSHAPGADSRELLLQLVQATNLLQLLQARSQATCVSRMRASCVLDCLSCAGSGRDHRQGEDKRRGTTRSPWVPGRAHTGRPRTCPCGGSARDIAEEPSHTRAKGR